MVGAVAVKELAVSAAAVCAGICSGVGVPGVIWGTSFFLKKLNIGGVVRGGSDKMSRDGYFNRAVLHATRRVKAY